MAANSRFNCNSVLDRSNLGDNVRIISGKIENGAKNLDRFLFAASLEQPSGEDYSGVRTTVSIGIYLGDSGRPNRRIITTIAKINWTAMGSRHAMAPPA